MNADNVWMQRYTHTYVPTLLFAHLFLLFNFHLGEDNANFRNPFIFFPWLQPGDIHLWCGNPICILSLVHWLLFTVMLICSQSEKGEIKDSVRAIFLWGDSLQTHAPEIQPVSVCLTLHVWQHGNFDISVALEFSIGLWGFETVLP